MFLRKVFNVLKNKLINFNPIGIFIPIFIVAVTLIVLRTFLT